jgi:hypothetical protein
MGGLVSSNSGISEQLWNEHRRDFESVGLTQKSVGKLHNLFCRCKTGVGFNYLARLASVQYKLGVSGNKFMKKAFSIFELEPDECLTFKQFVFALWNFLSLPPSNEFLGLFAFDMLNDGIGHPCSGKIIKSILKSVYSQEKIKMSEDIFM